MINMYSVPLTTLVDKFKLEVAYSATDYEKIRINFFADEDGDSVAVRSCSLRQYSARQLADAHEFCNRMNNKYRWLRFYIDSDMELTAAIDAVVTPSTAGAECFELLARTVNIVDDVLGEN